MPLASSRHGHTSIFNFITSPLGKKKIIEAGLFPLQSPGQGAGFQVMYDGDIPEWLMEIAGSWHNAVYLPSCLFFAKSLATS
jgi:hypothetical protein